MKLDVFRAGLAPVKGTRHLATPSLALDDHGPIGDRSFCLVDVSQGRVLRTVQHPSLIAVTAKLVGGDLSVVFPDGRTGTATPEPTGDTITCDYWGRAVQVERLAGPHSALFSDYLGKAVELVAAPRGGVVFGEPVTLVTTASLHELAGRAGYANIEAARFRPTFVVDTDQPLAEDGWQGREITLGPANRVRLRIGNAIPRCAVIDHHPETGVRDVRLLKALASFRPLNRAGEPCFGVFARVAPATTSAARSYLARASTAPSSPTSDTTVMTTLPTF